LKTQKNSSQNEQLTKLNKKENYFKTKKPTPGKEWDKKRRKLSIT
jgi:hypothetical protein